ncbi:AmmeMemoRadiSam system protein B [Aquibium carbonis]|uniref:AmmeMemoRadiSam system protein B n=1 Tax=Aquibium carbonis TaxID=2495581 RepID=A0A429YY95_9HYPH|nr:AmmeMemoRadiSam system protein B [Aquibium carbonis]
MMRRLAAVLAALVLPAVALAQDCAGEGPAFPSIYAEDGLFRDALRAAEPIEPLAVPLTGVTVPHHLLAPHLIAEGLKAATGTRYERILLVFPDHFRGTRKPFATTLRDVETVFGTVPTDRASASALVEAAPGLVDGASCLFGRDHGLQALLPFVHALFPDVPVLPVAASVRGKRADWDAMAKLLAPFAGEGTLVVQSTDFSHFLPHHEARSRDQQTLNVLAARDLDQIAGLHQSSHADSIAALVVQESLQRARGAVPLVVANENGQEYDFRPVAETTSYMVVLYGRFPDAMPAPDWPRSQLVYLAGDTSFGRAMQDLFLREAAAEAIADAVLSRTAGRPLLVNLEGVILPNVPGSLDPMTLAMPQDLAIPWLQRLNVVAASLANNHALDLGEAGLDETRQALDAAGIAHAGQGGVLQLAGLDIVALTDIGQNGTRDADLVTPELLVGLADRPADRPLVGFVHWGDEYATSPGRRELDLAQDMSRRSFAALVGGHSHIASTTMQALAGGDTLLAHSLGNFIFDQSSDRASGALLEIRTFAQGTFFARLVPLPNLFEAGKAAAQQPPPLR